LATGRTLCRKQSAEPLSKGDGLGCHEAQARMTWATRKSLRVSVDPCLGQGWGNAPPQTLFAYCASDQ
jgi:hypothetical protein